MNKCCLLNPEKKFGTDPSCRFREKRTNAPLIPKNDVTEPKARLSNNSYKLLTGFNLLTAF